MIDTSLSVVLHLSKGGKQALCVGKLRRHDDKLLASPTLVGPAFAQFASAEIDESALDFMPGAPGGTSFYHYCRLIDLDSGKQSEFVTKLQEESGGNGGTPV
jgi:hypothetical protein